MVAQARGLPERFINDRIERDDPTGEFAARRLRVEVLSPGRRQFADETTYDSGREIRELRREPARSAAEIAQPENDAGADDADADLARPGHGEQKSGVCIDPADSAEEFGRDDRHRVSGQCGRIGREVAQHRRYECARCSPQCHAAEKQHAILREESHQQHAHHGADNGADHAEPALAQRRAELRLTHDRRRGAGPERIVELQPVRDIERQTHRRPQP
jgi:hypothetical protein